MSENFSKFKINLIKLKKNLIKFIFYSFCISFWLYQNYQIFHMYFSYKTVNSIDHGSFATISLPAITLCIEKHYLLRNDFRNHSAFLREKNNRTERQESLQELYEYLNNFSIEEQFNHSYSFRDVFGDNCRVLRPQSYEYSEDLHINCELLSPVLKSMDFYKICFTILSQTEEESDEKYITSNSVIFNDFTLELFNMTIVLDTIPEVLVFIHSRKGRILNTYKYNSPVVFERKTFKYSYISYKKTSSHALETPYESDCHDYRKRGHFSRDSCIHECRREKLRTSFNAFPGSYLVYENKSKETIFEPYKKFVVYPEIDQAIGKSCMKECGTQTECDQEFYSWNKVVTQYFWLKFSILIFAPSVPDIIYTQSPKLIFEEFVSYVGSLVGLWFGFSIIMLSDIMRLIIIKIRNGYHAHVKPTIFIQKNKIIQTKRYSNRFQTLNLNMIRRH